MKKLLLLVGGIALLTVACRAEVNVLVDINDDRSGTVAFEFGLDDELRGLIESSGGTTDDLFGELDLGLATEGGTVTERTDGDMTFTGATRNFDDISEAMTDLVGETSGEGMFTDFSFVMDDESAAFAATAAADEQDMDDLGLDASALAGDVFSANFILGMPGNVVEHNADEVLSDGRLKWTLPLLGGTKTLVAKSEFGGSSLWWLWIVLGAVLVVGVIAIIAAVVLGRRQEQQAVTDAAAQYPQSAADALGTPDPGATAAAMSVDTVVDSPEPPDDSAPPGDDAPDADDGKQVSEDDAPTATTDDGGETPDKESSSDADAALDKPDQESDSDDEGSS